MRKSYLQFLGLTLALAHLSGCSSAGYLIDTGLGHMRIMNRARPLSEVLANPKTSAELKQAIQLVGDAKRFAIERLGLKATANYNEYVELEHPYASYVVTASHPFRLEPRTWHFPIVGEIPYIGFFHPDQAKAFAEKMREETDNALSIENEKIPLDVHVRGAPAYSTLGWFPDPLMSSMLKASERRIVDTVVHESVHSTIFLGSNIDFNERLANFVGLEASLLFLRERYGAKAPQVIEAENTLANEKIFAAFIDEASKLFNENVAADLEKGLSQVKQSKATFYERLPALYSRVHAREKVLQQRPNLEPWKIDFSGWNNAVINGHRTYQADMQLFTTIHLRCERDLRRFLNWVRLLAETKKSAMQKNPEATLAQAIANNECPK